MSDPQDLLYTNRFIDKNVLTNEELSKESEYYNRFKSYIDNGIVDETQKYIENNLEETSEINIDKTLYQKWPVNKKKNHYPLFDTYINDISEGHYKKEIVTKINIDSKNRDISNYLNSNNFTIPLGKVFNNIKKVVVSDINFRNMNQSINNTNNNLAWQYPSQNFLLNNNIDNKIIPNPGIKNISFSSLPNSAYAYTGQGSYDINIENYLVYQTNINPGFYNIESLIESIKKSTCNVLHGQNSSIEIKIIEQPYLSFIKMVGCPHLFSCSINPLTNVVNFVNRIEEVEIAAIQTFSPYETNFSENDVFYNFLSNDSFSTKFGIDQSYIYIVIPANDVTYQYYWNTYSLYRPNPFPLVITNLTTTFGNIDPELINYVEFFDLSIYLFAGYDESELTNVSYYKVVDTINITNNITNTTTATNYNYTNTYLRLGLKLAVKNSNINSGGTSFIASYIKPSITENIIILDSLKNILNNYNNVYVSSGSTSTGTLTGNIKTVTTSITNNIVPTPGLSDSTVDCISSNSTTNNISNTSYTTSGITCDYKCINDRPLIGRALLYRWIYDKDNGNYVDYEIETDNVKKRSLLNILAWPIANETLGLYTIDDNYGFKFVHSNKSKLLLSKKNIEYYSKLNSVYPLLNLNLQYISEKYYFVNNSYIFLKLNFNSATALSHSAQYYNAISDSQRYYNQVYIDEHFFNVGIGEDYTSIDGCRYINIYKKDQSDIFAKLMVSNVPGNYDFIASNTVKNSYYVNYDFVDDNISEISVGVYDSNMTLLTVLIDFSFTLEIHEINYVLKETLVDSKTNSVSTTGNFI
jgi:hypothetical protein